MRPPSPLRYATTSDGVRIAYLSIGEGPPLVLASNIFGDASGYCGGLPSNEIADRIVALGWRVIMHDPRGMGGSDRNVDDHSLALRVRDLAAVVGALGLDRFALGGTDIGAATAVAYAVENPKAVSCLALVSPWASGARYLELPALRAAYSAEASGENERKLFANIVMAVASGFQDPNYVLLGAELLLSRISAATLKAYNAANARIDVTDLLPRVSVPTLVMHEPSFPFGSFALCQEVAAGIPNAEFVILEIAGQLDVAVSTVERHLVNVYNKIGARGRADAIAFALRSGIE
jgi:pimeloyl-ACP methyl ester carboxylesterase